MASPEKKDSSRFAGGRTNFSQTCSLLSQYLKEKGSFGELSLSLTPKFSESKGTVNFLPLIEKSGRSPGSGNLSVGVNNLPQLVGEEILNESNGVLRPEKQTRQMTIFYAGQVMVFDDLPTDKAEEIMKLASTSGAPRPGFTPPHTARSAVESAAGVAKTTTPIGCAPHVSPPALASDLPIARKNSLARFLEKRKDRITANAPYQVNRPEAPAPTPPKRVKTEPWLGLAPQPSLQVRRH